MAKNIFYDLNGQRLPFYIQKKKIFNFKSAAKTLKIYKLKKLKTQDVVCIYLFEIMQMSTVK